MSSSATYAEVGFEPLEAPAFAPAPSEPAADHAAVVEALRAEAEQAVAQAREEGFAQGAQAGREQALAELAPLFAVLDAAATELRDARAGAAEAVERQAVELALRLAERIVAGAIEVQPERVVDVVRGALRGIVERERVAVLVHPDDLELLTEAADALAHELGGIARLEVQAERRVARGGAVVRTELCEIDATAAGKLERAREVLAEALAGEGG